MQRLSWILRAAILAAVTTVAYGQMPEVAPGVTLPGSMVSVVDQDASGQLKAIRMESAVVASDPHTGANVAKGLVYAGQKNSIQITGKTSAYVLHNAQPAFYVRLPDEHRDMARNQWTLLRLKPTAETRIAMEFTANSFGGHRKRKADAVDVDKADFHDGDWVKITPSKPLEPGEYALVPMPDDPLAYSETIYDFTIAGR